MSKTTILVVDDHAATRTAVVSLLEMTLRECNLLTADSAEQALSLCVSKSPALVIMDIALPGMDGFEAVRQLKRMRPQVHVVMYSASDVSVYREESVAAGADAFVSKGRASSQLVPVILRLLPSVAPSF
jgi:two-component system invasion response regulator UvrY